MARIRIVCAGLVAAMAVALAVGGAQAQTASGESVGKPLPLLAGLRPPPESKHTATRRTAHGKAAHGSIKKTAAKQTHARFARKTSAKHTRHVAFKKHEQRERSVAVATPVAMPPLQTAPSPVPAAIVPAAASAMPPADVDAAPPPQTAALPENADPSPNVVKVQTLRINAPAAPEQVNALGRPDPSEAAPAAAPSDRAVAAPASQTVLAAPPHRKQSPIGSASWMAQVLAALGGAVAAGAVAWALIGGGPVRSYG